MPKRNDIDEYTLLCERCGYVIEGLPKERECPECGKPIAESLPERRVGTPWQRERTNRACLQTVYQVIRHPKRTVDVLHPDDHPFSPIGRRLIFLAGIAWGFISVPPLLISLAFDVKTGFVTNLSEVEIPIVEAVGIGVAAAGAYIVHAFVIAPIVLSLLTLLEQSGIRFLAARHGYRLSKPFAKAICGHGCVGWFVGAALAAMSVNTTAIIAGLGFGRDARTLSIPSTLFWGWGVATPLALLAGFLFFEWFAWLGLRRCKFANRIRLASEVPPKGSMSRDRKGADPHDNQSRTTP